MQALAVGIDLGTTFSVIAVADATTGAAEILPDKCGHRLVPSVVFFESPTTRTVGNAAKDAFLSEQPGRTCASFKRFMGKTHDATLAAEASRLGMTLARGRSGRAEFVVALPGGGTKRVAPEELSAAVLAELLALVEERYGVAVTEAVITVPARFTIDQREATKQAGAIAGLSKVTVLNEPTAAALAYGIARAPTGGEESVIVVFDFGGGTFDVTVMRFSSTQANDEVFTVLATDGDTALGGQDVDKTIAAWAAQEFKKSTPALPDVLEATTMRRLLVQCEVAKRNLAMAPSSTIVVESFYAGKALQLSLSRAKMNELCRGIFERVMGLVESALKAARQDKNKVDKVVMVGGSSRIVRMRELMRDFFAGTGAELLYTLNADEAIAMGAAAKAWASKSGPLAPARRRIQHNDALPLSLGIETKGELFSVIVPSHATVPITKTERYVTSSDNQTSVSIVVFEGEHKISSENIKLGQFDVTGVPPRPAGQVQVDVTMTVTSEGVVHVSATCLQNGQSQALAISCADRTKLSEEEVEAMRKRAERPKVQLREREHEEKVLALRRLEELARKARGSPKKGRTIQRGGMTIEQFCAGELTWADAHSRVERAAEISLGEIESRVNALTTQCEKALE